MKEVIIIEINDFVQEFWRTSSNGAVDSESSSNFFALRRLLDILQESLDFLEVCILFPLFATAVANYPTH